LSLFESDDPFIQQAARYALAETSVKELLKHRTSKSGDVRLNIAILLSESLDKQAETAIPELLKDTDPRVRLVTLKWIAIRRLARFEPLVLAALQSDDLTPKLFDATLACVELLRGSSGQKIEDGLQQMTADLLAEGKISAPVTALALRKVRGIETKELGSEKTDALSIEQLLKFVNHDDPEVRLESVRSLRELNDEGRHAVLCGIATDASRSEKLRATAIVGLSPDDVKSRQTLMALVQSDESSLRNEALRSLRGTKLSGAEQAQLRTVASKKHEASELIARLLETDWKPRGRPQPEETDRWMVYAKGGDAAAGERVFFHPQGARCAQCHQIKGRGGVIGPDLSSAGLPGERRLIESIVTPSREMAPRYVPWIIVGVQGQVFTGIFLAERHEDEFYADADGTLHRIDHTHIAESVASTKSLMPDGLVDQLTDQELRDLLAYLKELR
jgi:putative heme-binding domain-containing protein